MVNKMKISDMILKLNEIRDRYGDLPIVGGYMRDDEPPTKLTVIDEEGCDVELYNRQAVGVFIQ